MSSSEPVTGVAQPQTSTPPAPPTVSPDGRFWWDGQQWQPLPTSSPATPPVGTSVGRTVGTTADQVAGGIGKFFVGLLLIPLAFAMIVLVATSPTSLLPLGLIAGVVAVQLRRRKAGTPKP